MMHQFLLLDEPTEGLDRETERQILRLILAHAENKTLINGDSPLNGD